MRCAWIVRNLAGQVALVTGAGLGMGRAHAILLAERGAKVVVQDIDEEGARGTATAILEKGGEADVIISDVGNVAATTEAIRRAEAQVGGIDILVNNAGVGQEIAFEEITKLISIGCSPST